MCRFHLRWVANANPISSGIWALSLFSNASPFALGLRVGNTPKARLVGIQKAKVKPGRPNASWWNIVRVGFSKVCFALAMYISCCLCHNANVDSGGLRALNFLNKRTNIMQRECEGKTINTNKATEPLLDSTGNMTETQKP